MNKMRCVVTGSTGFVGTNLIAYLNDDFNCIIPVSVRDLIDESIIFSCNSIVHLAGKAHDVSSVSLNNQKEYDIVNYEITKKLFNIFLTSNAEKFIFISSVKAVSDSPEELLTEGFIPNPKTPYGISKYRAEKYLLSHSLPSGKLVYILRPCMIHGPGNRGNLNLLYKLIQKGIPYPLSAFENKRSFLSIENFCFTIKQLLTRNDIPSGIYNIADDKPLSTNRIVDLIACALNKKKYRIRVNRKIIILLAKIGDYFYLPFNSERLKKMVSDYIVSNEKLKNALGMSLPIDAEVGLKKTLKSFKINNN
jgi:nucleoside-diphosphate-sugar epimerase